MLVLNCWRIFFVQNVCIRLALNDLSISFQASSPSRQEMKLDHVEEEKTHWKLKDVARTSNIPFNSSTTLWTIISIAIRAWSGMVNVVCEKQIISNIELKIVVKNSIQLNWIVIARSKMQVINSCSFSASRRFWTSLTLLLFEFNY